MQVLINSLDIGKAHHDKGSGFWYAVQASVRTGESMHANAVMQTTCNWMLCLEPEPVKRRKEDSKLETRLAGYSKDPLVAGAHSRTMHSPT
jgi:hypothetical protein